MNDQESKVLNWLAEKKFNRFDALWVILVGFLISFHLYIFAIGLAVCGWLTSFTIEYLAHGEDQ